MKESRDNSWNQARTWYLYKRPDEPLIVLSRENGAFFAVMTVVLRAKRGAYLRITISVTKKSISDGFMENIISTQSARVNEGTRQLYLPM